MKRILMILAVAVVTAAIMVVAAAPLFADVRCTKEKGVETCRHGNGGAIETQRHGQGDGQGNIIFQKG